MRRLHTDLAAIVRFALTVLVCALAACASSVCPTLDAHPGTDATDARAELEDSARFDAAPPDVIPGQLDAADRDAWGCSPCAALRECCQSEWGPACEIIDRNFSLDWCEGRYGRFVSCGTCAPLDCATVRAVACLPRD